MGRARLRQHIVELLKLAAPVIVARAGLMVMSAVDILIVARYSSEELAYLGLGTLPASMLVTAGIGMLLGTMIMTSHAVGAGAVRCRRCRAARTPTRPPWPALRRWLP